MFLGVEGAQLGGDGVFSAGLLTELDSELDFTSREWRVYPSSKDAPSRYSQVSAELRGGSPGVSRRIFAEVELNGLKLHALFDTGHPRSIVVHHETGIQLGLWNDETPYAPLRTRSIAGPVKSFSRLVCAKTLKIGPMSFDAVLMMILPPDAPGGSAIVGLPLIRTMNLFVRSVQGRLFLTPSGLPIPESFYSRSGALVSDEGGRAHVVAVGAGSPSEKGGLRVGDIIQDLSVAAATTLLEGPPGAFVSFSVQRPTGLAPISFTNSAYL